MLDHIKMLYDYHYWACRLVWDTSIMALTEAQFTQPLDYSMGSIHNQIVHTLSAEWNWFSRLRGVNPTAMLDPADYPTREAIRAKWDAHEAEVRAYINTLDESVFETTFSYKTMAGEPYTNKVIDILLHVVNHATDHRAQILAMIHGMGAPTVAQDIIYYLRAQR
jgi:uncharacterized damage-inducible protein DinB